MMASPSASSPSTRFQLRAKRLDVMRMLHTNGAADSASQRSLTEASIVLDVSPPVFAAVWTALLLVRVAAMVYLVALAALYRFLAQPEMSYYALLLGPHATAQLHPMAMALAALALAHLYKIVSVLWHSAVARRLVFDAPLVHASSKTQPTLPRSSPDKTLSSRALSVGVARRVWRQCFGRRGFFGVESAYFQLRFTARESFEIISQTLQLQTASHLIARHWINDLYVGIVLVNCWSTPVVQHICRRQLAASNRRLFSSTITTATTDSRGLQTSQDASMTAMEAGVQRMLALERMLCLSIDLGLDLATAMVLPAVLVLPYVPSFDVSILNFPSELLYNDVWFVNMVYEFQQVLAVTTFESVFTFFPHWSIYSCCGSLRALIRERRAGDPYRLSDQPAPSPSPHVVIPVVDDQDKPNRETDVQSMWFRRMELRAFLRNMTVSNAVHLAFFVWGLGMVALHLLAVRNATQFNTSGCKQTLRPWLTQQSACSVFEFNCYQANTSTVRSADLSHLDAASLAVLVLSHCSALIMPDTWLRFDHLLGLEIYNSSIAQWTQEAAISPKQHQRLSYLLLIRVNMSNLPTGIATELPANLMDIEIAITNLTGLPDHLDEVWHPLSVLYVENAAIVSVPPCLTRLKVDELSLSGNKITSLSVSSTREELDWSSAGLLSLCVNHNPLHELPTSTMGDTSQLSFLRLEYTQIAAFPEWVQGRRSPDLVIYAAGSTFCHIEDEPRNELISTRISCTEESFDTGRVPIKYMTERRQL
ncbi:hypothetical protein PINS_up010744 [Pythium insidiosum]|nr:hypothetical protein PINS_up010744 [Pythium insidiosum]